MTPKQQRVYDYLREYRKTHGRSPTMAEGTSDLGLNHISSFDQYINALVKSGHVRKMKGARGIEIVDEEPIGSVPLAGLVSAGKPIENSTESREWLDVRGLFVDAETVAYRVRGESMVGSGILDGDYALVSPCKQPQSGRIVVAMIDGQLTLKTMKKDGKRFILMPSNPSVKPIVVDQKSESCIVGCLVGVIRKV